MWYFVKDKRHALWIVVCHIERMLGGNRHVFPAQKTKESKKFFKISPM
jgi:hypothetical protein